MNLGETILRLRTGRGMSQEDLASALEVSRQSVSKWETGASVPELDKLMKLSALFGVTLDELVTGEKQAAPPLEPPVPEPAPPRREPDTVSTAQRVAGWILMGLAAAACLFFVAVTQNILGVLFSLPFLVCGVICLTVRRNAGLWCAWTVLLCVDLYIQSATGISWSMILLPQIYTMGMYAQLATAWAEALFTAALIIVTVTRFRKRPVEWTRKKRLWFIAGLAALVLLSAVPYQASRALLPYHITAYRILILLLGWSRLALTTALLTALAQGVWKRSRT